MQRVRLTSNGTPALHVPGNGISGAFRLHGFEQLVDEDRLVLAAMHLAPIGNLADAAIAEWNGSANPEALALGGRELPMP